MACLQLYEPLPANISVPETFLHHIWQHRLFNQKNLHLTDGSSLSIINPGRPNPNAGPDFLFAHLRINKLSWHGDIEIHRTSSEWVQHGHHREEAYNRVILHVVLTSDRHTHRLTRQDGTAIPELVLYRHLQTSLRKLLYQYHTSPTHPLLCASYWTHKTRKQQQALLHQRAHERLQQHVSCIVQQLTHKLSLEEILYRLLFTGLGYSPNKEAMFTLAQCIPLSVAQSMSSIRDLEALYFGQAGLLPPPTSWKTWNAPEATYAASLWERFQHLRSQINHPPMSHTAWKFARLRPANFPTLRVAQGIALLWYFLKEHPIQNLVSACHSPTPLRALRNCLQHPMPTFWQQHIKFSSASNQTYRSIGKKRIDVLILNAVYPVMLTYAHLHQDLSLQQQLHHLLEKMPPMQDRVTRIFHQLGYTPTSALDSLGMYQLYSAHCQEHRCLTCPIGQQLIKGYT